MTRRTLLRLLHRRRTHVVAVAFTILFLLGSAYAVRSRVHFGTTPVVIPVDTIPVSS